MGTSNLILKCFLAFVSHYHLTLSCVLNVDFEDKLKINIKAMVVFVPRILVKVFYGGCNGDQVFTIFLY